MSCVSKLFWFESMELSAENLAISEFLLISRKEENYNLSESFWWCEGKIMSLMTQQFFTTHFFSLFSVHLENLLNNLGVTLEWRHLGVTFSSFSLQAEKYKWDRKLLLIFQFWMASRSYCYFLVSETRVKFVLNTRWNDAVSKVFPVIS